MSINANPYHCDVCGRPKGEGNGWLLGIICDQGVENAHREGIVELGLGREVYVDSVIGFAIIRWDEKLAFVFAKQISHLCSDKCALTKQAEYIRR